MVAEAVPELPRYSITSLDAIPAGCLPHMRLCITADIEDTELRYLRRYGRGHTFYFRLRDRAYGEKLAGELYGLTSGHEPDMKACATEELSANDQLYLFIHIPEEAPKSESPQLLTRRQAAPYTYYEGPGFSSLKSRGS